jgi:Flp pilus assembly protein TadD
MTAALAKELQLPVTYQALVGHELWSRDGDLNLAIGHVNILVAKRLVDQVLGLDSDAQLELSFGAPPGGRGLRMRSVGEQTILAMFMNNRAAEWLARGDPANAYAYAREAVVQDPRYAGAYNTLGVIYQRRGLAAKAEHAFGLALELDADSHPAMANLARLFESQRRDAEAKALRVRLARLEAETPFLHLDLGRAAALAGDFRSAREHLLREMKRDPEYHEVHYWLAVALAGLGDATGAREHLATAMKNSTTRREHAIYAGKLERLQAATRSN